MKSAGEQRLSLSPLPKHYSSFKYLPFNYVAEPLSKESYKSSLEKTYKLSSTIFRPHSNAQIPSHSAPNIRPEPYVKYTPVITPSSPLRLNNQPSFHQDSHPKSATVSSSPFKKKIIRFTPSSKTLQNTQTKPHLSPPSMALCHRAFVPPPTTALFQPRQKTIPYGPTSENQEKFLLVGISEHRVSTAPRAPRMSSNILALSKGLRPFVPQDQDNSKKAGTRGKPTFPRTKRRPTTSKTGDLEKWRVWERWRNPQPRESLGLTTTYGVFGIGVRLRWCCCFAICRCGF